MVSSPKPPRRIVIGNNENGKSVVLSDTENPYQYNRGGGSTIYFNEIWTFDDCPIDLSNSKDGANRPLSHSPPLNGAHFRVIESRKEDNKKIDQQAADKFFESMNRTGLSEKMKSDVKEIKFFLKKNMYNHKKVITNTNRGKKIIEDLFTYLFKNTKKYINKDILNESSKERAISDFIAGMTDRYAINLHKKIK